MLQIYNTLTKQKQEFKPLAPKKVSLYVCGVTVYDYCHIGHARAVMVIFDMVVRYLRYRGYEVTYVRNITDIDDKIIVRAQENKESVAALTERFIKAMHEDERALGVLAPDQEPRATETLTEMIQMIQVLLDKDYAYVGDNGDVFYRVAKFAGYGKLSHQNIESLRSGERIAIDTAKADPLDFVLWKIAKPDEPSWDSPWGAGRPGWHIECAAMSTTRLGNNFDIHGGGLDLQFPHHENEIAQAEAATDCHFANYWMHVGLLQVNSEKMSKSLGNFFLIRDALQQYDPEVIRYFMIASHYRSPINYSAENLAQARTALVRFYTALRDMPAAKALVDSEYEKRFVAAMNDDFNTPVAIAALFDLARDINKARDEGDIKKASQLAATLKYVASILGLLQQAPEQFLQGGQETDNAEIEALITARQQARAAKNWAESDRIRDQLVAMGIVIEDNAQGTSWKRG